MLNLLKRQTLRNAFLIGCVLAALFNLSLRPSGESDFTLYRALFPFHLFTLAATSFFFFKRYISYTLILTAASLVAILFGGYGFNYTVIVFYIHYLTIGLFVLTGIVFHSRLPQKHSENLPRLIFCILFLFSLLEFLFGYTAPNVEQRPGAIRAIFLNENDLCLAALALALYFYTSSKSTFFIAASYITAIGLSYYNKSQICLIACLILPLLKPFASAFSRHIQLRVFVPIILLLPVSFILLQGGSFLEPIYKIITNSPYHPAEAISSISARTNLTIWGIQAFFDSSLIGIGPGNSLTMIENRTYGEFHGAAKSLHNFPVQVVAELGISFLIVFIYLYRKLPYRTQLYVLYMLFISLSQSVGIFSNITYFLVLGYLLGSSHSQLTPPRPRTRMENTLIVNADQENHRAAETQSLR